MGFIAELDGLSPAELEERWRRPVPDDLEGNDQLWFEEIAVALRRHDRGAGAAFLLAEVAAADADQLAGIILGLRCFAEPEHEPVFLDALSHPDEYVVATAIDGLAGIARATERVLALDDDPRDLVRGAVLRFARRVTPAQAPARLIAALADPGAVVRWNAVDELAELGDPAAAAAIEPLYDDPHPGVAESAREAVDLLRDP